MASQISNYPKEVSPQHGFYIGHGKAYGLDQGKAYGKASGQAEDPQKLAAEQDDWWTNKAIPYYNDVIAGKRQADPKDWQSFLDQMHFIYEARHGSSPTTYNNVPSDVVNASGDLNSGDAGGDQGNQNAQPQSNDFGGMAGADGSWVYNDTDSHIYFNGDPARSDAWAYNNTLEIPSTSAKVSYEITSDGLNPASKVLRVRVTDPALQDPATGGPLVSEYYYHNFQDPDFKLKITAPKTSAITGDASLTVVTTGVFKPATTQDSTPQSSIEGSPVTDATGKTVENAFYYEAATKDQTIEFAPQAGGAKTNEDHYVMGNSKISIPLSSEATVSQGPFTSPDGNTTYDYKIEVKHKDGSTDTFYVQKDFTVDIKGMNSKIHWSVDANGDGKIDLADYAAILALKPGDVPTSLQKIFKVNGAVGSTTDNLNANHPEDTIPDSVSDDGKTATYNVSSNIELHATFDDDITTHNIATSGVVTLHSSTYDDTVEINKDTNGAYVVKIHKGGSMADADIETYNIVGDVSKIKIEGFLASKITNNATTTYDMPVTTTTKNPIIFLPDEVKTHIEHRTSPDPKIQTGKDTISST